jgi:DNA phosphorothioation-associated putative methyltransferase
MTPGLTGVDVADSGMQVGDAQRSRGLTAIARSGLSRPVALAVGDGLLKDGVSFFDFGCGRGGDVAGLREAGFEANGWDPVHSPGTTKTPADVVNLGYVVNVIEDTNERKQVLLEAWRLARRALVVAARLDWDSKKAQSLQFGDGIITSRGTFQKYFTHEELRQWIKETLEADPDVAGPGVFYVFRSAEDREAHLAHVARYARYESRRAIPELSNAEANRVLEPLLRFMVDHGRPPAAGELQNEAQLIERCGSLARAVRLLARVADPRQWEEAAIARQRDLLVYLALGSFRRQPLLRVLPRDLQLDIRAFFGTYGEASRLGKELLFGTGQQAAVSEECGSASVGKLTQEALYVHVSAVSRLPVLLRVYEGCGRMLLGDVPGATLVKLRRDKPQISYLCYPEFDSDPHPQLLEAFVADLRHLRTHHRNYGDSVNPPVLHRKECFVAEDYPQSEIFARLTRAEVQAGLLDDSSDIGTRDGWLRRLASLGYETRGHDLSKAARPQTES